jgi:hypothetical protein
VNSKISLNLIPNFNVKGVRVITNASHDELEQVFSKPEDNKAQPAPGCGFLVL